MRSKILNIVFCLMSSFLLVVFMYDISNKLNSKKNGFIRLTPSHAIFIENDFNFDMSQYYIAGLTEHNIYLANYKNPNIIMRVGRLIADTQYLDIAPINIKLAWWSIKVQIDSPDIYLMDGVSRIVLHNQLKESSAPNIDSLPISFDGGIFMSSRFAVVRNFKKTLERNILSKVDLYNKQIYENNNILEKQIDGLFSVDGMMCYSKSGKKLIYLYFYRNQFICLDSDLNLMYRGNTIDTNTLAKLNIKTYESGKTSTLSSPPLQVNVRCFLDDSLIYIQSSLLANNEEKKLFDRASVVDIYSLFNGKYKKSFYLPMHNGNKVSDFVVSHKKVIAIYKDGLIFAHLNI